MALLYELVYYASAYLPFVLIVLAPVYFFFKKDVRSPYLFLFAMMLNFLAVEALKGLFNVPRPFGKPGLSFPSGHASLAFGQARFFKSGKLFLVGIIYATFVSIGRVLTGFHTIQDVFAGGLLGYGISEILIRIEPRISKKLRSKRNSYTDILFHFLHA